MTKKNNQDNGNGLSGLIGLAKQAYTGAPHGVAQMNLSNPDRLTPENHWSWKSKRKRKQEIIDTL